MRNASALDHHSSGVCTDKSLQSQVETVASRKVTLPLFLMMSEKRARLVMKTLQLAGDTDA